MALVALRTGLDGFLAFPPQAGAETRCTTGPTSRRLLHPGPCGFGPAVPGVGLPYRLGGVAQGPWAPEIRRCGGCSRSRSLDAIALVRRHLWLAWEGFSLSVVDPDIQELPVTLYHRLVDSLAYAA